MPMNIETAIKRALESAFSRALAKLLQTKAEASFKDAFASGSIWSTELEERFERILQHRVARPRKTRPKVSHEGPSIRY